jgi:hypothetical protein
MWTLEPNSEWDRRRKQYEKKNSRELSAVLDNLDTFFKTLNCAVKPRDAKFGFIHPEPLGVLAIDQKGGGPNLAQTRLYVYPDETNKVLHLITLGDKRTQPADIATCKVFVSHLRRIEGQDHGSEKDVR